MYENCVFGGIGGLAPTFVPWSGESIGPEVGGPRNHATMKRRDHRRILTVIPNVFVSAIKQNYI